MPRLIYTATTSLDGYVADEKGNFDWTAPDDDVFAFISEREEPIGTYLYGRRMYETMRFWERGGEGADDSQAFAAYARLWRAADKVVFSGTLGAVDTARTRLLRTFDAETVMRLRDAASRDLSVGGATLAGTALRMGLVDECRHYVKPVLVGGGTSWLPAGVRARLELFEEHRFTSGTVYLRYGVLRG
jgi:dihydrofolate reductase